MQRLWQITVAAYLIDCLKIVPSHLKALLTASEPASILPRQRLILGGETVDWGLVAQIRHLAPQCLIFNHYGPTEATIGALTYAVEARNNYAQTVPLGKAIANTQVYLLDEHLQLVPIGVKGELYIGGAGVARGYLNQPELTTEKFIQNPFSNTYSRLYKTGDLARYLPDGNIEFLGRIDDQVKIRGYRVELGEISIGVKPTSSSTPSCNFSSRRSTVRSPFSRLYRSSFSPNTSTSELRHFLQEQLPEYMIPCAFVFLKALPLTSNGKVDRQLLPIPDQSPELATTSFLPALHLKQI
jgi:acyl-coenzyme A synthetase/AMP-(fatty) acid ligase